MLTKHHMPWTPQSWEWSNWKYHALFFIVRFVLSMVNTWLSLFSPYFRKFENDVLGYPFWWIPNQFMWLDSRYFSWCKIQVSTLWSSRKEDCQPGAEERKAEAKAKEEREAEAKEGYEKKVSRFKAMKEISLICFDSVRWVWCQITVTYLT